jgi:acyl dehydratase
MTTSLYPERYFDEFEVGEKFVSPEATLTREECLDFARRYDPQPFHLDDEAAAASVFRKLSASGWHTAAIAMRLVVDSGFMRGPGLFGVGIDELRWLAPVYPDDTLHVEGAIVELTPNSAGKRFGLIRIATRVINQNGICVMSYIANLSARMR